MGDSGAGVGLVALTSLLFRELAPPADPPQAVEVGSQGSRLAEVLAAAVPIGLGLAVFHASFAYAVYLGAWNFDFAERIELDPRWLVVIAVLLALFGWTLYYLLCAVSDAAPGVALVVLPLAFLVVIVVVAWLIADPWSLAAQLGGVGVFGGFLVTVTLVGGALVWVMYGLPAPAAFRAIGFSHTPVFLLLVVWLLVASALDKGGYHDVRPLTQP